MNQNTVKNEIIISGIGLHSGKAVSLKIKPSSVGTGIVFIRIDLPGQPKIQARISNVTSTIRGTNLGEVNTVEHLLSALYAFNITNAEIELDSPEPPVLDGSSKAFCDLIRSAGTVCQGSALPCITVKKPIIIQDKDRSIIALPSNRFIISFMIDYCVCFIGCQYFRFSFYSKGYSKEIAPARTYGFMEELSMLKEKGLALGATRENAIVIDKDKYLTKLRFHDELVRHKILDLIGDLSLLNSQIKAHIICIRSGHDLNFALAKNLKEVG